MTSLIFGEWLTNLDARFRRKGCRGLLFLDNFSGHTVPVKALTLTNVKVHFIPPNTTSILQPCNAGIIRAFKAHYRSDFIKQVIGQYKNNPGWTTKQVYEINLLEAMNIACSAWEEVSPNTIKNCFSHTGIIEKLTSKTSETTMLKILVFEVWLQLAKPNLKLCPSVKG